jgi:hypothetical protein
MNSGDGIAVGWLKLTLMVTLIEKSDERSLSIFIFLNRFQLNYFHNFSFMCLKNKIIGKTRLFYSLKCNIF